MSDSVFLAIRAIGSELGIRLWRTSFYTAVGVGLLLIVLLVWLVSFSGWWWLLLLPIVVVLSIAAAVLTVFFILIRHVRPPLLADQKNQVRQFVDKLQLIQELSGTPKFIILFRTIRSLAAPRSDSYLKDLFNAKDLAKDFREITKSFGE